MAISLGEFQGLKEKGQVKKTLGAGSCLLALGLREC